MKTKKVIFLILCLFYLSLNFKIYQPYEVINYPKKDLDFIKQSISKILYDFYAFYELVKSPPQPEYDQNF